MTKTNKEIIKKPIMVTYTHPALKPIHIDLESEYVVNKDEEGVYIVVNGTKHYYDIEKLKALFTPVDNTWDKVEL